MDCGKLLEVVARIKEKYDEIAEITGENFNIFKILRIESVEKYHSRILAELLNPKGKHDCGGTFLKLFIKQFTDIDVKKFDGCQVYLEYYTEKYGRPDIYINGGDVNVIIENKINMVDGDNQLKKYRAFLDDNGGGELFYLTKYGEKATNVSNSDVEYKPLAYCSDIITWLEDCQKEVINKPLIRETLEQYINSLKYLTKQTRSNKMSEKIIGKITESEESMIAAIEIRRNLDAAKKKFFNDKIVTPLNAFVKEKYGIDGCKPGEQGTWESVFYDNDTEAAAVFFPWESGHIRICWSNFSRRLDYGIVGSPEKINEMKPVFNGFDHEEWSKRDKDVGVDSLLRIEKHAERENFFGGLCCLGDIERYKKMIDEVYSLLGVKPIEVIKAAPAFLRINRKNRSSVPMEQLTTAAEYLARGDECCLGSYPYFDNDQAIADYTEAIRLNPNDPVGYCKRGLVYEFKDESDKALADYTEAIRVAPNDPDAYVNRGHMYYSNKDYDKAVADFSEAIRLDANGTSGWYLWRGDIYQEIGEYDKAIADYTEVIRRDDDSEFVEDAHKGIAACREKQAQNK